MVEAAVREALDENATSPGRAESGVIQDAVSSEVAMTLRQKTEQKYRRPWWVCQPHIRPLPEEALQNGALKISKKELAKSEFEWKA